MQDIPLYPTRSQLQSIAAAIETLSSSQQFSFFYLAFVLFLKFILLYTLIIYNLKRYNIFLSTLLADLKQKQVKRQTVLAVREFIFFIFFSSLHLFFSFIYFFKCLCQTLIILLSFFRCTYTQLSQAKERKKTLFVQLAVHY